ncbi:hypothetical protein CLV24_1176 [Pontibacter ummariensis]|uniref:Uncharacterized protein n=1 Tax=Pontibacter ummariensis TaxID=1610492 RepID=A0A239IDJ7_9BACT|nr:hypothetical protein CLV24_1176 [Pontibacter ummariensis]SNS91720.1 hypothetical protein SAMN06296052_1176 [Pontibacter ummariensis]
MLQGFFGSIFLEFIGALARWCFTVVINFFKGEDTKSFKEVWTGNRKLSKSDSFMYSTSNIIIGIFVVLLLCYLVLWLER